MNVRPVTPADREWIAETVSAAFGSVRLVSHGELIEDASSLDGFAVEHDGRPVGCALLNVVDNVAELVAPYIEDLSAEDQRSIGWLVWDLFQEGLKIEVEQRRRR